MLRSLQFLLDWALECLNPDGKDLNPKQKFLLPETAREYDRLSSNLFKEGWKLLMRETAGLERGARACEDSNKDDPVQNEIYRRAAQELRDRAEGLYLQATAREIANTFYDRLRRREAMKILIGGVLLVREPVMLEKFPNAGAIKERLIVEYCDRIYILCFNVPAGQVQFPLNPIGDLTPAQFDESTDSLEQLSLPELDTIARKRVNPFVAATEKSSS